MARMMVLVAVCVAATCCSAAAQSSYSLYQSPDPQFPVSFEYPQGWEVSQGTGSYGAYKQVMAYAPLAAGSAGISPGIVVTQEDVSKALTGASTATEYISQLAELRARIPEYREIARSTDRLLEEDAAVLECSYSVPDRLHGSGIAMLRVRERIVAARKGGFFYTLRYVSADSNFDEHSADAAHAAATCALR